MKNVKFMDVLLGAILITTLIFTGIMIWLFILTGKTPDTLISMWFTYVLGECGVMGLIKSVKTIAANWALRQADIKDAKEKLTQMSEFEEGK